MCPRLFLISCQHCFSLTCFRAISSTSRSKFSLLFPPLDTYLPICFPCILVQRERSQSSLGRCSQQGGRNFNHRVLLPFPLPLLWHSNNDPAGFSVRPPLALPAEKGGGHRIKGKSTTPPCPHSDKKKQTTKYVLIRDKA